jgi:DUF177 domain-containing protein
MKIVIADIPDEGLIVDVEEEAAAAEVSAIGPARARLQVTRSDREVIVSGMLTAELELQCSRCLRDFRKLLDVPVNVVYHPIDEFADERRELKDEEMDMGFYRGEEIDLQELVREQVLLNMQMKPLCTENCKGICPRCGADLNASGCKCETSQIDPRLEVLKKLLEKGKE